MLSLLHHWQLTTSVQGKLLHNGECLSFKGGKIFIGEHELHFCACRRRLTKLQMCGISVSQQDYYGLQLREEWRKSCLISQKCSLCSLAG